MNRMETNTPRVSILIPVYNREAYIETCVRSAMRQTVRDIEIVVVDNHSEDGTWAILQRLAAEDPRIRIFRNPHNLGAVPNWRRCMEQARADIGKLLFSDDTIREDYLEKTLPWLEDDKVGFVFTAVRIGTDAQEREGGQLYYQPYERDGVYPSRHFVDGSLVPGDRFPVSPGCALMRLKDMKRNLRLSLPGSEIADFDAHGAGPDLLLYLLTAARYEYFACMREPLCFFRIHPGSLTINDPNRYIPRCHQAARDWFRTRVWQAASTEGGDPLHQGRAPALPDADDTADTWLEEGEALFAAGDLAGAEQAFLRVLALDAGNAVANNDLGVLHHQRGDQPQALEYLVRALEADPDNRDAVSNTCAVLAQMQEASEALRLLDAYLHQHPDDTGMRALHEQLRGGEPAPEAHEESEILVSAIVSTYNSEAFLRGCLEDLLAQSLGERIEIIVIDSGSEQGEGAIVKAMQADHPNIRYLRTERETIYAAWNRGVRMARGRYLTNANADDRHRRDALERMARHLEQRPDVALVYADSKVTRAENAGFDDAPVEACFKWPEFEPRNLFSVCYIGPQPMWRRSLHDRYGYFDAQMKVAGDYDFWLRLATQETFLHIPELLGLYLLSQGSVEHAQAAAGVRESELARERNWPAAWGQRPPPGGNYLVAADQAGVAGCVASQGPLVSIIMPTRDRLELLGRALDSVIAQRYRNWELLVINDGGDSVRSLIKGRDADDRIRFIELDRSRGQATARNLALRLARGEIICYLDDDDLYLADHLQTIVDELAAGERYFVYTDAVVVSETLDGTQSRETGRSNPYAHTGYSRERLLIGNYIPINTWAHRRECLDAVSGFDETLNCYEDWEFLLRLSARYEFHHIERTTVEVRHRADRVDNVSRHRLSDTVQAYRRIYQRHDEGVTVDMQRRRDETLQRLEANIGRHLAAAAETVPHAMEAEAGGPATQSGPAALSERDIRLFTERMQSAWTLQPAFHLLVTHVPGLEQALADTLDGLAAQIYGGWGLSVVSSAPCPDPVFEETPNLEWVQVEAGPMDAVNRVARESSADWIGLIEAGDTFEPHMLYRAADFLQSRPECRLIYMDEDRIDATGTRHDPLFKPDFNLELLRAMPYMGHCLLVRRDALAAVGGYADEECVAAYELALKVSEIAAAEGVGHLPGVLLHRQDRFQRARDEQAVAERRRQALERHLARCGLEAVARHGELFGTYFVDYTSPDTPPVDIFVRADTATELLATCVDKLVSRTEYPSYHVNLLVPEGREPALADAWRGRVTLVPYPSKQGYQKALAARIESSDAPLLLFMNPGVIPLQADWLARLLAPMQREDVAVVAPRLVSAHNAIVDGGIILGGGGYSVGAVAHSGLALRAPGYMGRAQVAQELGAVTDNCLLIRRAAWQAAGGFSAAIETPLYRSVDLCRRVAARGGVIVWTPHPTLLYLETALSEKQRLAREKTADRESPLVCGQWLAELARDPAYNPNLSLRGANYRLVEDLPSPVDYDFSRPRVLGFGVGSYGSWQYRAEQPLHALHRAGLLHRFMIDFPKNGIAQLPSLAELERLQVDALLFHNTVHDYTLDALRLFRKVNHAFVVFGEDDLITALPPKNPFSKTVYKDIRRRLRQCCELADRLVVTTEPLAEALSRYSDDVQVVPNGLDEAVWGGLHSARGQGEKLRVGWAGAQQHLGDLELLREVVEATTAEVDWVFFGMCPEFLRPHVKEIHNPVSFAAYPEKLAGLNLDLAVAPLELNDFNRCKSNLRLLEYGALAWPVIASDIEPYRDAPVCRVKNQPRAWINAIRERVHDPLAAYREGDALRQWVRRHGLLQQRFDQWLAVLDKNREAAGEVPDPARSVRA